MAMRDASKIIRVKLDKSPNRSTKPHPRKFWGIGKEQFLFWTMVSYMVALVGAAIIASVHLWSLAKSWF